MSNRPQDGCFLKATIIIYHCFTYKSPSITTFIKEKAIK